MNILRFVPSSYPPQSCSWPVGFFTLRLRHHRTVQFSDARIALAIPSDCSPAKRKTAAFQSGNANIATAPLAQCDTSQMGLVRRSQLIEPEQSPARCGIFRPPVLACRSSVLLEFPIHSRCSSMQNQTAGAAALCGATPSKLVSRSIDWAWTALNAGFIVHANSVQLLS